MKVLFVVTGMFVFLPLLSAGSIPFEFENGRLPSLDGATYLGIGIAETAAFNPTFALRGFDRS